MAQLTREFYEQNIRSAQLRNVCLYAITLATDLVACDGEDEQAIAGLLDVSKTLRELGIKSEMHVINPEDPEKEEKRRAMESDPVLASEWAAGQVLTVIIETSAFSTSNVAGVAEHDELLGRGGPVSLLKLHEMGPKSQNFVRNLTLVNILSRALDYSSGPTDASKLE